MQWPVEYASRPELAARQQEDLEALLALAWERSPFYRRKWAEAGHARAPVRLADLPLTTRAELNAAQAAQAPAGDVPTVPTDEFVAVHRTAGVTAAPIYWFDTAESWQRVRGGWDQVFRVAGAGPADRIFFAFDFAPVLCYWAGFERAQEVGMLTMTGGAFSPLQRVETIFELGVTILVCDAAHALELAQVASQHGYHPARSSLRAILYSGARGTDPRETGRALEAAWGAEPFCVSWQTEAGITGFECEAHPGGVHLLESDAVFEVIDPDSLAPVAPGEPGELVVTVLGRTAMPVIRYRTGDRVCLDPTPCSCGRPFLRLAGGPLGVSC